MKKAIAKNKAAEGCRKISSFFTKRSENGLSSKPTAKNVNHEPKILDVIDLESEDEESESLLRFKAKTSSNKRKFEPQNTSESPPLKSAKILDSFPQPSTSGLTRTNATENIHISTASCIVPSTSGGTPVKNRPLLSVKTPEKLLSPAALKQLNSPTELSPTIQTKRRYSREERTPDKHKSISKKANKSSSGNKVVSPEHTPNKSKKTPKKLFEKSPSNLNEFNVEVLRNFVKITPTKKEVDENETGETHRKSLEAQFENEKTPVKDIMPNTNYFSPKSKVRTKLNFTMNNNPIIEEMNMSDSTKNCSEIMCQIAVDKSVLNLSEKENHDTNNLSFIFDENSWEQDFIDQLDYTLDLTKSRHCKIVNVNQQMNETIITVRSTQTNEHAICTLKEFWMHSKLCIGDTVHIMASKLDDSWLINNKAGFLVFEPDLLISTTTVVNSVFCKRRTVFQERFRGFDPTNKYMIVGNMVHSLVQDILRKRSYQLEDIKKCAQEILLRKEWTRQIYESGESLEFITEEFMNYIPKVYDFLITYVCNNVKTNNFKKDYKKDNWKGKISGIEDIEENIWCPTLGVKGKVDVSIKNGLLTMPLEIKTGRASVSLEHRAQVLLYIMMMNKLGYQVSSGLLLYLKEGVLKEIPSSANEQRDIIILRNELAYFLSRTPKVVKTEASNFLEPGEIPEPIDHPSCSKCPYNSICVAYSKYSNEDITNKKSLRQVHNDLGNFLTSAHIDYFMHWSSLLSLEMSEKGGSKSLRDIYTLSPEERKNTGKCLIDLSVQEVEVECNGTFSHTFKEIQSSSQPNFLLSGFFENSYVVVSVKNRPAVASGFITHLSMESVTVCLDRNLNNKYKGEIFFLDSYDSSGFLTFNLASLALLLDITEHSNQLRSIIVDRQPATFQPKLPRVLADKAKPILKRLNKVQQRAVLKAMAANEYFLIKGMPGTGKTATIVALIQLLIEMNQTVLITSHTHSAVDTVCRKLITYGIKFMRLGSQAKIDPALKQYSEHFFVKNCKTPDDLERVYNSVPVIAVTCLGSGHPVLSKRTLDVCIVDESTQVLQCSVFRPLHAAKKFILIGDPDQLPAVVKNKTAIEFGMNESLFERLDSEESRISLNLNYRMNEPITTLANVLTYNGELEIGAERIAKASLNIPKLTNLIQSCANQRWIVNILDTKIENAVQLVDTGPVWNLNKTVSWALAESCNEESQGQENQKCLNIFEAAVIYRLVEALIINGGVSSNEIGIIATYRVQVALLTQILKHFKIDVSTVDKFQGKDKNIIIYSCSKSKDLSKKWVENKFDITEDKKRLNVAITRAKHKLIIVGDLETLDNYSTFRKIKGHLKKNIIKLSECDDFNWDITLDFSV